MDEIDSTHIVERLLTKLGNFNFRSQQLMIQQALDEAFTDGQPLDYPQHVVAIPFDILKVLQAHHVIRVLLHFEDDLKLHLDGELIGGGQDGRQLLLQIVIDGTHRFVEDSIEDLLREDVVDFCDASMVQLEAAHLALPGRCDDERIERQHHVIAVRPHAHQRRNVAAELGGVEAAFALAHEVLGIGEMDAPLKRRPKELCVRVKNLLALFYQL